MLGTLWYAISHPGFIAGRDGLGGLVLISAVFSLTTLGFMVVLGRRLIRYSPALSVATGTAILPVLLTAMAFIAARNHPPGTDGGGMLIAASIMVSVWMVPVTLVTSLLYVHFRDRPPARPPG